MPPPIDREEVYEVTVNGLTAKATPSKTPTPFNPGTVVNVEIVIPPGVAGLAGLRISQAGTQIFPTNAGAWLIGDDEIITRDVYNWPNSGRLEVEAFNEDANAHTFILRYGIAENPLPAPVAPKTAEPIPTGPTGEALPPSTEATAPTEAQPAPTPESPSSEVPPESPSSPVETPPVSTPPPPESIEQPSTPAPPEVTEPPPPAEAPASEEPPPAGPTLSETEAAPEGEAEAPGTVGATGGVKAPGGPALKRKAVTSGKGKTVTTKETLPAGGWLPAGAKFVLKRTDQGQDFITDWKGAIVAPAAGTVVHVLADKPFPSGFGPHYAVVHIDTGPFGGKDWYIGHCTAAVTDGQKFKAGAVLAHADQGHVEGGGWCELGYAPNGYPGPMGDGAKYASLFRPVVHTTTKKVKAGTPKRKAAAKGKAPAKGKAAPKRTPAKASHPTARKTGGAKAPAPKRTPAPATHKAAAKPAAPARRAAPPAPVHHAAPPPPRRAAPPPPVHHSAPPPPPPPRRAPPPPPPPPPRAAPPPPPKRRK